MHDDQVDVDVDVLRRLLAEQRPELANRQITPVVSTGTVNALFRIGDDLVARLPWQADWAEGIEREGRGGPLGSAAPAPGGVPRPGFHGGPTDRLPRARAGLPPVHGGP